MAAVLHVGEQNPFIGDAGSILGQISTSAARAALHGCSCTEIPLGVKVLPLTRGWIIRVLHLAMSLF